MAPPVQLCYHCGLSCDFSLICLNYKSLYVVSGDTERKKDVSEGYLYFKQVPKLGEIALWSCVSLFIDFRELRVDVSKEAAQGCYLAQSPTGVQVLTDTLLSSTVLQGSEDASKLLSGNGA